MYLRFSSFLLGLALLASACTEPSDLGLSLVEEQRSDILYTDTLSLRFKTVASPPFNGSNPSRFLIGQYQDPIFGQTEAALALNFRITSTNLTFDNASFDSLVLQLAYDTLGHYGDVYSNPSGAQQTWEVLRLEEALRTEETYKTDKSLQTGSVLAGDFDFIPRFRDSVVVGANTLAPQLRIPLAASLGQELLSPGSNIYATNNTFKDAFKGVLLRPVANGTNGSLLRFLPRNRQTKLVLYYTQPDDQGVPTARSVEFLTDEDSESLQLVQHDYQAGQGVLSNAAGDSLAYVQGMNGVGVEVEIPYLASLGNIAVNRAELQVFSTLGNDSLLRLPSQLISLVADGQGNYIASPDTDNSLLRTGSYLIAGGNLLGTTSQPFYTLNLSRGLQDLLQGEVIGNRFYIQTSSIVQSERLILGNGVHPSLKARLLLTYTRLD